MLDCRHTVPNGTFKNRMYLQSRNKKILGTNISNVLKKYLKNTWYKSNVPKQSINKKYFVQIPNFSKKNK